MSNSINVMSIFGTRPEAIKMAPVVLKLEAQPAFHSSVAVTAQHRDMLDQVLHLFDIHPDFDLDIMAPNQSLFDITSRALLGLQDVLSSAKPDIVLVHGDTTTSFAAALAAFYLHIPVAHVEAGLRTFDKYSPFPEEMNRKLTGSIADLHFSPTQTSRDNLIREGVDPSHIFVTGNTVIDALFQTVSDTFSFKNSPLQDFDFGGKRLLLVTTHRRENLGEPMRHVYKALKALTQTFSDVEVIFPVHKNPKVRQVVNEELGNLDKIHLIDPLDYAPFANIMARSTLVLTDSGGLQEEAPALGKPVLVLRNTTERPEALEAGTVKLVGTDFDTIYNSAKLLLSDDDEYHKMSNASNPYGDGHASDRIVSVLMQNAELMRNA